MSKEYTALGLMSGTSGDGVDASIIISDGINTNKVIHDKYFEYDSEIYKNIHNLKDRINSKNNLKDFSKDLNILEKKITLFHAKVVKDITKEFDIDLLTFCIIGPFLLEFSFISRHFFAHYFNLFSPYICITFKF